MTRGFEKAVILGATGPTGIHLTSALRGRVPAIRVVSRSPKNLERAFPEADLERFAADVLEESAALRAIEGCDVVFDCIGLPSELMDRHPNWMGGADVPREHTFVEDAMKSVVELAHRDRAYGERFVFTGDGVAAIAGRHLGREVKLRSASSFVLRIVALFNADLRSFLPMVPHYVKPLSFDAGKLRALVGAEEKTPYPDGIPRTLDWLRSQES